MRREAVKAERSTVASGGVASPDFSLSDSRTPVAGSTASAKPNEKRQQVQIPRGAAAGISAPHSGQVFTTPMAGPSAGSTLLPADDADQLPDFLVNLSF